MSEVGIATFLRFFTGNTTVFRWQNFFVGKTVDGHSYQSFAASDIALNRSASEGGIGLTLPLTKQSLFYMEAAYNEAYLIEVQLYELDLSNGMPTGIGGGYTDCQVCWRSSGHELRSGNAFG